MYDIQLPIVLIILGIFSIAFSAKIGIAFCKTGKAIWKITTFGLTDMRWFYPEDKAPTIFRYLGFSMIFYGVLLIGLVVASHLGPNYFALSRETENYLKGNYGDSIKGDRISIPTDSGSEKRINYNYNGNKGKLIGKWNGEHYEFKEIINNK